MLIKNPLSPHSLTAKQLFEKLDLDLSSGKLTSESDVLLAAYKALIDYYTSLGVPATTIESVRRGELPIREQFNRFFTSAQSDTTRIMKLLGDLRQMMLTSFNLASADRAGLETLLSDCVSSVDKYCLLSSDTKNSYVWFSDGFNDSSQIDLALSTAVIKDGSAHLAIVDSESLNSKISAVTIDSSLSTSGFPGNSLEIKNPGFSLSMDGKREPEPEFYGGTDSGGTVSYSDITQVFDGNPDTWFEWESYFVNPNQKVEQLGTAFVASDNGTEKNIFDITKGYGWNVYKQLAGNPLDTGPQGNGYRIVTDSAHRSPITLSINVEFDKPTKISEFDITPYVKNGAYPTVANIELWEEGSDTPYILENLKSWVLTDELASTIGDGKIFKWTFPARVVTKLRVNLLQSYGYTAQLGHLYSIAYLETKTTKSYGWGLVRSSKTSHSTERVQTGSWTAGQSYTKPNIGLNLLATAGLSTAAGAITAAIGGFAAIGLGLLTLTGFSKKKVDTTVTSVEQHYDIFNCERVAISVRDIDVCVNSYLDQSIVVSKMFTANSPFTAVSIITDEEIPESFGEGEWIKYQVAFDGSNDWQTIVPHGKKNETIVKATNGKATSVQLKITFTRPTDSKNETPVLNWYSIKCLPEIAEVPVVK